MIDRQPLHRVTATMIRHALAAEGGSSERGLVDPEAWRDANRHALAERLATRVLVGTAHLHDLYVLRESIDAQWRARWRRAGAPPPPGTPPRHLPGPPSRRAAAAALRAHADRLVLEEHRLPDAAGRLVADLLHLLVANGQAGDAVILAALDTVLAEAPDLPGDDQQPFMVDGDPEPGQTTGGRHA